VEIRSLGFLCWVRGCHSLVKLWFVKVVFSTSACLFVGLFISGSGTGGNLSAGLVLYTPVNIALAGSVTDVFDINTYR
jgi:hypothetical protein